MTGYRGFDLVVDGTEKPSRRGVSDHRAERGTSDAPRLHGGVWANLAADAWVWGNLAPDAPVILAVHGVTANHLAWAELAKLLPEAVLIAPDLRGRGLSADLPGPYGLDQHVEDVATMMTAVVGRPADLVLGHSMGGFVTTLLRERHPELVDKRVLIDGGIPTPPTKDLFLPGSRPEKRLGLAWDRLSKIYASPEEYRDAWRKHPAFQAKGAWTPEVQAHIDYDCVETPDGFRSRVSPEAVLADIRDLRGLDLMRAGRQFWTEDFVFMRAPRGFGDNEPPVYPKLWTAMSRLGAPSMQVVEMDDVNHYTAVLGKHGAAQIAAVVRPELGLPQLQEARSQASRRTAAPSERPRTAPDPSSAEGRMRRARDTR